MPPQETDEIDRRKAQILALDIHRTGVQAESAAGAGVDFRLGDSLARMRRLEPGVPE